MTEDLKLVLDAIHSLDQSLNAKIDSVNESLNAKIDSVNESLNAKIDDVNESLNAKIDDVNESLNTKIDSVNESLNAKIDKFHNDLWQAINELRLSMDNEVKHAIRIVAEGHLDLSRRLDKSELHYAHKEDYEVRLIILEQEVRSIKEKLKMT